MAGDLTGKLISEIGGEEAGEFAKGFTTDLVDD